MHEGAVSTRLGLAGQPAMAEATAVARDIALLREPRRAPARRAPLDRRALGVVREAKARGLRVTCEVTPHHLVLTDGAVARLGLLDEHEDEPAARARSRTRRRSSEAIADGTIDAIATDHAPHHRTRRRSITNPRPSGHRSRDGGLPRLRPAGRARKAVVESVRRALLGGTGEGVRPARRNARGRLARRRDAVRSRGALEGGSRPLRVQGGGQRRSPAGSSWSARRNDHGRDGRVAARRFLTGRSRVSRRGLVLASAPRRRRRERSRCASRRASRPRPALERLTERAKGRGIEVQEAPEGTAVPRGFEVAHLAMLPPSEKLRPPLARFPISFEGGGFTFDGRTYAAPSDAILLVNPSKPSDAFVLGGSEKAVLELTASALIESPDRPAGYRVVSGELVKEGRFAAAAAGSSRSTARATATASPRRRRSPGPSAARSAARSSGSSASRRRPRSRAGRRRRRGGPARPASSCACSPTPRRRRCTPAPPVPRTSPLVDGRVVVEVDASTPNEPELVEPALAAAGLAAANPALLDRRVLLLAEGARRVGKWWGRDVKSFAAFTHAAGVDPHARGRRPRLRGRVADPHRGRGGRLARRGRAASRASRRSRRR